MWYISKNNCHYFSTICMDLNFCYTIYVLMQSECYTYNTIMLKSYTPQELKAAVSFRFYISNLQCSNIFESLFIYEIYHIIYSNCYLIWYVRYVDVALKNHDKFTWSAKTSLCPESFLATRKFRRTAHMNYELCQRKNLQFVHIIKSTINQIIPKALLPYTSTYARALQRNHRWTEPRQRRSTH